MRRVRTSSYDCRMRLLATSLVVVAASLAACGDVHSVIVLSPLEDGGSRTVEGDASVDDAAVTPDAANDADGGSDASVDGPSGDPVFGTSTFVPLVPGKNANGVAAHPAAELPLQGKNCFKAGGCHAENGYKYGFAGTVYATANGGASVGAGVEVAVAGVGSAYTDADGNFWFAGPTPPAGSRTGVRDAFSKAIMADALEGSAGAQCNSGACHGQSTMRIYLP
jgi:hypothetical protein